MNPFAKLRNLDATGWAILALGVIFATCLPIFLITINVGYVTDSDWLYTFNWWRNGIPDRTGLPISELDSAADQIKDYFRNDADRLDVTVNTSRGVVDLFVEREILHMIDVKELIRLVAAVSVWTGAVLALCAGLGILVRRKKFFAAMSSWLRWCALIWGIIVGDHRGRSAHRLYVGVHPVPPIELRQRPLAVRSVPTLSAAAVP